MNHILIYAVAASQIVVLFWLSARTMFALQDQRTFSKNAAWISAHPQFRQRHAMAPGATRVSYAAGALWLAALLAFGHDPSRLAMLSIVPSLSWLLLLGACQLIATRRVTPQIPLPGVRRASLQRRALRDYVPPAVSLLCGALYLAIFAVYGTAWASAAIAPETALARLTGMSIILLLVLPILVYALRRKDGPHDLALGPQARKWEVILNFVVLYGGLSVGAARMVEDFLGVGVLNTAITFAAINLCVQAILLIQTFSPYTRRLLASESLSTNEAR